MSNILTLYPDLWCLTKLSQLVYIAGTDAEFLLQIRHRLVLIYATAVNKMVVSMKNPKMKVCNGTINAEFFRVQLEAEVEHIWHGLVILGSM